MAPALDGGALAFVPLATALSQESGVTLPQQPAQSLQAPDGTALGQCIGPGGASLPLGGEPLKISAEELHAAAATAGLGNLTPASPTPITPRARALGLEVEPSSVEKLELPMKLLRLDSSGQVEMCEESPPSADEFPARSLTEADAWTSPFMWGSPVWSAWPWLSPGGTEPQVEVESFGPDLTGGMAVEMPTLNPGSEKHTLGNCKPCAWFWKPSGCQNAATCCYCHICPEGELKARKKAKVAMMRLGIITPKAKVAADQENAGNILRLSSVI